LCSERGQAAQQEADTLALCFAEIGAEGAARIWRDMARMVRDIQRNEASFVLQ
jgi:hypothetical protein